MPHKVKVILFFICLIFCANCSKVDRKKFENLYRAGKAIDGATSVGVSYKKFGELLQNLATEIYVASDKAKSGNAKKMIESYSGILQMYKDSHLIWKYQIETPSSCGLPSDQILVKPEMKYVIERYSLKRNKYVQKIRGWTIVKDIDYITISEDSIKMVWLIAKNQLKTTNKKYFGY